jgi:glycosyltransferase involved in cell wall biosynthesis
MELHLNILFVLYGDLNRNTAVPITLFSKYLHSHGHRCVIAIPDDPNPAPILQQQFASVFSFNQILENECIIFPNGERADVVHACTPRINVYDFICKYMSIAPTPLAVYLEDNEDWITQNTLNADDTSILGFTDHDINEQLQKHLSHPFNSLYFIGLCDLAILIQKKLSSTAPSFIPQVILPWGVDLNEFSSRPEEVAATQIKYNIPRSTKVLVYHGGLNPYTYSAIRDLCDAVIEINEGGTDCVLLRSGPEPLSNLDTYGKYPKGLIQDLGVLPREELPKILNIADVLVQPGRINPFEDLRLPSKIPEFLAMGKPVLLPNCNIADIFTDGVDAITLKVGNPAEIASKCLEIFKNPKLSAVLGEGARRIAEEHFDINKQTLGLIEAYKETIRNFRLNYDLKTSKAIWEKANSSGLLDALCARIQAILKFSPNLYEKYVEFLIWQIKFDQSRINSLSNKLDIPSNKLKMMMEKNDQIEAKLKTQDAALNNSQDLILALQSSTSWNITAPLRWLSHKIRTGLKQ